ncbi:MAG: thioredoxin [Bacteroidales bacterium]|nr:thioredoxin [Bacteroidales bacterium]
MPLALIIILAVIAVLGVFIGVSIISFKKRISSYDQKQDSDKIIILNDNTFQHKIAAGVALVDFWAEWCQPCKIQGPIVSSLADEIDNKAKICKLDVEKNKKIAGKLGIKNIPTIIIFKNGKEVERLVGLKTKAILKKALLKHM